MHCHTHLLLTPHLSTLPSHPLPCRSVPSQPLQVLFDVQDRTVCRGEGPRNRCHLIGAHLDPVGRSAPGPCACLVLAPGWLHLLNIMHCCLCGHAFATFSNSATSRGFYPRQNRARISVCRGRLSSTSAVTISVPSATQTLLLYTHELETVIGDDVQMP